MKEIEILDRLINICVDSQKRYEHAASDVGRADLEQFFKRQAEARKRAASELQRQRIALNGEHKGNGSWAGTVDRAAMDFSVVMSMGDSGVVEWCRKDSEDVLAEYRKALAANLSPKVREIVERQRREAETTMATLEEVLREYGGPRS